MTTIEVAAMIGAIASTIPAIISLYKLNPKSFSNWVKKIAGALADGVPFGFIPYNLPLAIILFTAVRIGNLIFDLKKSELKTSDIICIFIILYAQTGVFAAICAWIYMRT